jgi:hypothetical protein
MGSAQLIGELSLLSYRVNAGIKALDKEFFDNLVIFRNSHSQSRKAIQALSHIDPLLLESRELIFNVQLHDHFDQQDPRRGMAVFAVFGEFHGGALRYKDLNYRHPFHAGDMVFIRGRMVKHGVEKFTGQRISIPHFTHTSCWASLGLKHLVD